MDVGVYVDAHLGIGDTARRVEMAGFTHLWVYDSPLVFADPWMTLAVAATETERLRLGPGVTHPNARSAVATAQALGTLATVAPDRTVLGIGTGFSSRRTLGMPAATQDELIQYVKTVRLLLDGEWAEHTEAGRSHRIRFINQSGPWIRMGQAAEVWISAFGPKGQYRAGEVADGIIIRWEGPEAVVEARDRFRAGADAAGRRTSEMKIGVLFAVYPILDEDELVGDGLRAAVGPLVRSRLSYLVANYASAEDVPEPFRIGFDLYRHHWNRLDKHRRDNEMYEGYLVDTPDFIRDAITPDALRAIACIDLPEGVARELQRMADAGVTNVGLQIAGPSALWCERMSQILPLVV